MALSWKVAIERGIETKSGLLRLTIRRLELVDMDAAAAVHRSAFDDRLPWLSGLHTPDEARRYFCERVFEECEIWGALDGSALTGIIAFREGWIDQLYILPSFQRRGIGTTLLGIAQSCSSRLCVWTFQANDAARVFYLSRGFVLVKETDGSDNDEKEPDALYLWSRDCCRRFGFCVIF